MPATLHKAFLRAAFPDGAAIDDAATLNRMIASGVPLSLDGLDDIGVLGLGGPGGWYVPVRAKAFYDGPHDIGDALVSQAGAAAMPLAPFYVEGSADPYVLFAYLRDGNLLESSLQRLSAFSDNETVGFKNLALPAPEEWDDDVADYDDADEGDYDIDDVPGDEDFEDPQDDIAEDLISDRIADQDAEESEDAKYRAAMSPTFPGPDDRGFGRHDRGRRIRRNGFGSGRMNQKVVGAPFGRQRRGAGAPNESTTSDSETGPDAGKSKASVFKLSVPDIASPNIRAPGRADDKDTAAEADEEDTHDHVVAEAPSLPSEQAAEGPADEDRSENSEDENADRVKREDRPFFFDDPMV